MNGNLKKLFVLIEENKVIAFETNLRKFHQLLLNFDPAAKGYDSLFKKFQQSDIIDYESSQGRKFRLQNASELINLDFSKMSAEQVAEAVAKQEKREL